MRVSLLRMFKPTSMLSRCVSVCVCVCVCLNTGVVSFVRSALAPGGIIAVLRGGAANTCQTQLQSTNLRGAPRSLHA